MRKLAIFIIIFVCIALTAFVFLSEDKLPGQEEEIKSIDSTNQTSTQSPTGSTSDTKTQSGSVQSSWIIVRDMNKISLHSNLSEKLSAKEAKEKYQCNAVINGGFYAAGSEGVDGRHIGLFVADNQTISKEQENALFNGFFSITNGKAQIDNVSPANPDIALQTGPILMRDTKVQKLSLTHDENARRMIAAVTPQGDVVFLALYDSSSFASGPKLEDVPKILSDIDKNTSLELKDAINLDGGAHSAFISEDTALTDIQTPGSFFCIKN